MQVHAATVGRPDKGDLRIQSWRAGLLSYVPGWRAANLIDDAQVGEITYLLQTEDFAFWRPLLYIIDRAAVASRLVVVDPARRAGPAPEFTIADLRGSEFDVMELRYA